jgi:hypothetical protein
MNRKHETSAPLHLRIGRIVVDAEVLGQASRDVLRGDIATALAQHLSGQASNGSPALAHQIAGAVAPQVRAELPKGGRNGS